MEKQVKNQFQIKLDNDLKEKLQEKAKEKHITMSALICLYCSQGLDSDDKAKALLNDDNIKEFYQLLAQTMKK